MCDCGNHVCTVHTCAIWLVSPTYLQYIPIEWRGLRFVSFRFLPFYSGFVVIGAIWFGNVANSGEQYRCVCIPNLWCECSTNKTCFDFMKCVVCECLPCANDPINIKMPVIDKQNRYPLVLPFSTRILGAVCSTSAHFLMMHRLLAHCPCQT